MLHKFISWIRGVIGRVLRIDDAKRALKADIAISSKMQDAIDTWGKMFGNESPWLDSTTKSLGLSATIAGEFARLVTVEMKHTVTGSSRATYLQEQYQNVLDGLREALEMACACGGMAMKPYLDGDKIVVDFVPAWRFLPTEFNSQKKVTGAVFIEQKSRGKTIFTRMEHHRLTDEGYNVKNIAFRSDSAGNLGQECSLQEVDEWASLEPDLIIRYKSGEALERPLFSYFRVPLANNIDPDSPLGVSVYSRAVGLIEEADKQYSRILWEYAGSELAVDASEGALSISKDGPKMPARDKRLFRELNIDNGSSGDLYEVFSPAIRDSSLFNGLNQILRRIEFNCNLAYGTISDPQNVDKTAEEIKTSKQRSYSSVCDMQASLQKALEDLLWAMDIYASLYKLAPSGTYKANFSWGDGVLQDTDKDFAVRKSLVDGGYMRPELLIAWYLGISEEEALKMMPEKEEDTKIIEEE